MSLLDHSDSQQHHMATSAMSAAAVVAAASAAASSSAGPVLFARSLSAPHMQFSGFHDTYMYGRSVQNINEQLAFQQQQQQQQQLQQADTALRSGHQESFQQLTPHPFDHPSLPQMTSSAPHPLQYTSGPSGYTTASVQQQQPMFIHDSNTNVHGLPPTSSSSGSVHPFQMDQMASSINNLEAATGSRVVKFGYSGMSDSSPSSSSSLSPSSTPAHGFHPLDRSQSLSIFDTSDFGQFEVSDEYPSYLIQRHGSLGSLYPMTQSHELLEPLYLPRSRLSSVGGAAMVPSLSSTSISSEASSSAFPSPSLTTKSRTRRASLSPDGTTRVFTCLIDACGKQFKRSEHLKRHVRSVHTLEKPFRCPYENCPKRFSRSDNLNQHIRIHRHEKEKVLPKPFTSFTPFSPHQ
ncbi:hypothetical protein BGZ96_001375 [Linnemannia gamsii]|uniref:C2H2-type domain-containing protein n=1 Tax=Linnemannia gamsii TaxID=64522 RepID=A0ABQ7JNI5_9FUNG|nr:hypothetical protein BGZ96_001375 [Linnemannia gamsii]